jgi:hypothetical protein
MPGKRASVYAIVALHDYVVEESFGLILIASMVLYTRSHPHTHTHPTTTTTSTQPQFLHPRSWEMFL